MNLLALVGAVGSGAQPPLAAPEPSGLVINFFWVIVSTVNFLLFLVILNRMFGATVSRMLTERRARIEQGLIDAEQARHDRAAGAAERTTIQAEARREAREILERAQKVAQDARDADIAATKLELERLRAGATAEIEAEKLRALADLRAQVADLALAAAGRVVGETMSDDRQRRLVEEFLSETATPRSKG